jgi:hypothetical protein
MKKLNITKLIIAILFMQISISNIYASQSIRGFSNENRLIDEEQIIRDMERELDEEKAKKGNQIVEKEVSKNIEVVSKSSNPQNIDLTFFVLTLVGLVIAEIVIIFTDYVKPKYFDDLY